MCLVLRNIVFDLIFLASMNFPVIQSSCGTNSHNCRNFSSTPIEVFLLQNGIDRAQIEFEQPDTGANYTWTLRPFDGSPQHSIDLTSRNYNSSGDIFSLKPTLGNQGLYSCRTTTNTQQQCLREYCVRLMSSPMIATFNATYFVENSYTVFSLEVTYDNNSDVTTCLPVNVINLNNGTANVATCFGMEFGTCIGPVTKERELENNHMSVGSGFKYDLTVSNPPYTATTDMFTFFVTVRTIVTPSPSTSTRLIVSTETYSASATLRVISPATPSAVEMASSMLPMMSSSSSLLDPGMSSIEMMSSTAISSSTVVPSSTTTEPTRITAEIIAIVVSSAIGVSLLLVIFVIIFLFVMCLYPRIMNKRKNYNLNDGDNGTITTNGATNPPFELSPQAFSKEENI